MLQIFVWECSQITLAKCRNLKYVKDKFQESSNIIKGLGGSSIDGHPIIFCWANWKGVDTNLIELFNQKGHLSWRCGLIELPPRLCLGTILSPLGQSLPHMNTRTRLWVQSLRMA